MSQENNKNPVLRSSKKALIIYSSQSGCTEEIALKIKGILEKSGITSEVILVNNKAQFKALIERDLNEYSSFLLGSNIIAGKFSKHISKFLEYLTTSNLENKKLGFFISCMKARNNQGIYEAKDQYIIPNLKNYKLSFSAFDAFGGRLDFSPTSSLNPMIKSIVKKIMLKENPDMDKVESIVYDFRDWEQIGKFGELWAGIVKTA